MPRFLRSPSLASAVLALFLMAEPAIGCAALCLFERHGADAHAMPGMNDAAALLGISACHSTGQSTVQTPPVLVRLPMLMVVAPAMAVMPARRVAPLTSPAPSLDPPALPVEPPPPRLV